VVLVNVDDDDVGSGGACNGDGVEDLVVALCDVAVRVEAAHSFGDLPTPFNFFLEPVSFGEKAGTTMDIFPADVVSVFVVSVSVSASEKVPLISLSMLFSPTLFLSLSLC
jgi:hypothetical protein